MAHARALREMVVVSRTGFRSEDESSDSDENEDRYQRRRTSGGGASGRKAAGGVAQKGKGSRRGDAALVDDVGFLLVGVFSLSPLTY